MWGNMYVFYAELLRNQKYYQYYNTSTKVSSNYYYINIISDWDKDYIMNSK